MSVKDRSWWGRLLRESFGPGFWGFAAFAALMGLACYRILGPEAFHDAIAHDLQMLAGVLPRVIAALTVAGLVWVLLPRDKFTRMLGGATGLRGPIIATVAGIITPGGPASAFPFLAVMGKAGADRGVLIAYITSWQMLGVQRILVWDVPFMGLDFAAVRFLVCLPLPIVFGLFARYLPLDMKLVDQPGAESSEASR